MRHARLEVGRGQRMRHARYQGCKLASSAVERIASLLRANAAARGGDPLLDARILQHHRARRRSHVPRQRRPRALAGNTHVS